MSNLKDKTKLDNNRTLLNFQRSEVNSVLPDFYPAEYPNLLKLFEAYYYWMDSDANPSGKINRLYSSRDATQVPTDLLQYLEDELLLGQAYFGGFQNKREAIKFSNTLYRSKGTKYSIEQFFRAFYGLDPEVRYPKENVFRVGPAIDYTLDSSNIGGAQIKAEASKLGPEDNKYITDDKLYQVMSVLVRVGISVKDWLEIYKLFVHPAGVYIGAELLIEVENTNLLSTIQDDEGEEIPEFIAVSADATVPFEAFTSVTLIHPSSGDSAFRSSVETIYAQIDSSTTLSDVDAAYNVMMTPNSLTLDDSDTIVFSNSGDSADNIVTIRMDNHTFDTQYDSV